MNALLTMLGKLQCRLAGHLPERYYDVGGSDYRVILSECPRCHGGSQKLTVMSSENARLLLEGDQDEQDRP